MSTSSTSRESRAVRSYPDTSISLNVSAAPITGKTRFNAQYTSAETPKPVKNDNWYIRVAARGTVRPAGKQHLRIGAFQLWSQLTGSSETHSVDKDPGNIRGVCP
jgi:hypothetical protein